MNRVHYMASAMIIGAALATWPQPVAAQEMTVALRSDVRAGAEVRPDRLGDFVAAKVMIGETEKNLADPAHRGGWPVVLRVLLVDRRAGVIATYESQAIQSEPGTAYDASRWITRTGAVNELMYAPLKPAEFVIFRIGQWTIANAARPGMPRECSRSTHALLINLVSRDKQFGDSGTGKTLAVCLSGNT